ncbi:MAG: 6-carboxytetrahydropterin synthase [Phycisphaerales bacterium JB060]
MSGSKTRTRTIELTRTTRFCVNDPAFGDPAGHIERDPNGYAGRPAMRGLGRYYSVDVTARGEPDAVTGYLIDIKGIDQAVRSSVIPMIARACHEDPTREPATLLPDLVDALREALPVELASLRWNLTPVTSITMTTDTTTDTTPTVILRTRVDFAAAHRLHVDSLSDEENRRLFGKCNNPSGHGHNYQVEPAVEAPIPESGAMPFTMHDLARLTDEAIVRAFDHTNLNTDPPDFSQAGVNPSVEHIARVCYERLSKAIDATGSGARLREITVWETDRTRCTYPAS